MLWHTVLTRAFAVPVRARDVALTLLICGAVILLIALLTGQMGQAQQIADHAGRCKARGWAQGQVTISKSYAPVLFCVDADHRVYWID